ncbi:MAG: nitrite reductase [Candidatus Saccharibacteria bacterium]|nr:nitrite reductase [Candidatus Saccharibacteria bacterium]
MTLATPTHCPYCSLQCGLNLQQAGGALTVVERPDFPVNRGALCIKGQTSADLLHSAERLTTPLVRDSKSGELRPATWDEALDMVAAALIAAQAKYGTDAVGVFGGGSLTNEKAYQLGKFARVALRTSTIDYNGRFCMSSAAAANLRAFGLDRGLPFPLEDIAGTDCILLIGSNLAETMPPAQRYFTEQRERGGSLIVVDPRATPTARNATLHLQPLPGTDLALALGLIHIAVQKGYIDQPFIDERTTGWPQVQAISMEYMPHRVERITGVPAKQLYEAARLIGEAPTGMVLTARGAEQHSKGTDTVSAWINLALALGKAGRAHCGYGCLTGQGNGQGGREHGQKADQLPGYRKIDDPVARAYVAGVWGVDPNSLPGPGPSAYELLDSLGEPSGVRALLVMGSNPVISAPRAAHIEAKLRRLDCLIVADYFMSETAAIADVVLPSAQFAEEDGTMTNLEGRVIRRNKAVPPPSGSRTDLEILAELAKRLGHTEGFSSQPELVFEELRRASAGGPADYAGITYARIDAEYGVFWPCPEESHPGTPRMFEERFNTADGRARFVPVTHRAAAEEPDSEYPIWFTTGRVMAQYQSGTQTRRVDRLNEASPEAFVEMHPRLAKSLGITDGETVRVISRRGWVEVKVRIVSSIRPDLVFMPFHWGGKGRANSLTNPALDPTSRMPEFKLCAVRIERLVTTTD